MVAGACEREDSPPLMASDLRDDVRGSAKSIDAKPWRVSRHAQTAIADEARAHERRGVRVIEDRWDRKAVCGVGNRVLRISAVDVVPGELGVLAEILAAASAVDARAVDPSQPRHADAIARGEGVDAFTRLLDDADDLMSEHERQFRAS